MATITELEQEDPQITKVEVNLAGPNWMIGGRARFVVNGYVRDEGVVGIQNALSGEETELRIGGIPFAIEVAFVDALTKADALHQAAQQVRAIAGEFVKLANAVLDAQTDGSSSHSRT